MPVLLYDGTCALCNGTVRVVLRLDRRGAVRFAPLGGELASAVRERHPGLSGVDSLILVERLGHPDERASVKSDAVLRLARHLGGVWRLAAALWIVPRALRDLAYDLIAQHRYSLFGRLDRRPPPPVDAAARFLE